MTQIAQCAVMQRYVCIPQSHFSHAMCLTQIQTDKFKYKYVYWTNHKFASYTFRLDNHIYTNISAYTSDSNCLMDLLVLLTGGPA